METPENFLERLVLAEAKTKAAHERVDKLELGIKEDLKEIKKELAEILAWVNRSKGWIAAVLLFSGLLGGILSKLVLGAFKI